MGIITNAIRDFFFSAEADRGEEEVNNEQDQIHDEMATMDLDRFECLACQTYWEEGVVRDGVELIVETFQEHGKTFHGYLVFHNVRGVDFYCGFIRAAYALAKIDITQQVRMAEADEKLFAASLVDESRTAA